MTVLEPDEIKKIVEVIDYVRKTTNVTVERVKEKFHLEDDEYDMIMDLAMPFIREANSKKYWYSKYHSLGKKISDFGQMKKLSDKDFKKQILRLIDDKSTNEPYMIEEVGDDVEELNELDDKEIEEILDREIPLLREHSINKK